LPAPSISCESFDAGAVVNQGIHSNQIEGAIVQGIGGALFEQLELDKLACRMAAFLPIVCRGSVTFPKLKSFSSTVGAFPPLAPVNLRLLHQPPPSEQPFFAASGERIRQLTMLPLFSSERG
jgi:isoquinoline 1-oxidoreductase